MLYAETDRVFFSKVVDATIEFEADAQNRTAQLTLRQGAFTGKARKKE